MTDVVWLVTQGDYSDYQVVHAFSDEETATKHVEQWHALTGYHAERSLEPYEVLTEAPELAVLYHAGWSNRDWRTNERTDKNVGEPASTVVELPYEGQLDHLKTMRYLDDSVGFSCSSLDAERAIKIVSDARCKELARETGL